jgi:tRNA pseudouridine32 synthase/23S rRNA pseudouridine746 synthase
MRPISIIYENSEIIVVEKPSGVLTVPSRLGEEDARPTLKALLEANGFRSRLFPVHRLDFEASGIVVMALSLEAQRKWSAWFENQEIEKTYLALTEISQTLDEIKSLKGARWENLLVRGKKRTFEAPHGKNAVTLIADVTLSSFQGMDCLKWTLKPKTGRPHQLRFQLATRGFPILGDLRYGAKSLGERDRQDWIALRAIELKTPEGVTYRVASLDLDSKSG